MKQIWHPEVNARSNNGETPLHLACSQGHFHTVVLLLGHDGIDANVMNINGDTPLHVAVQCQRNDVVSLLLNQDRNLRKKLETFSPPQCVFCEDEVATETFFPCKHLSLCKKCCPPKIPKRCLKCGRNITSKNSLVGPNSSKMESPDGGRTSWESRAEGERSSESG
ncbi:E3 ubiquitin-protein ligase MIB2-like [Octopus vulgaris]|uniref:E3 ubiquitin-protein ligase MIB2-like n=1 Tax=Octopus vulgaris TaxID=6645 RepID=A0AA36F7K5_OCTVU|nr:E3 ubiquitin-protein ligase MIB2-like [Octopus vulgaris]